MGGEDAGLRDQAREYTYVWGNFRFILHECYRADNLQEPLDQ